MTWKPPREAAAHYEIALRTLQERSKDGVYKRRPSASGNGFEYWCSDDELLPLDAKTGRLLASMPTPVKKYPPATLERLAEEVSDGGKCVDVWDDPTEEFDMAALAQAERDVERVYRIVSLWDVHVPDADAFAFKAALDFIRDVQPDHVVLGGDFLELASCSQHGGDPDPLFLDQEIAAGRKALDRIRDAAPCAKTTYLQGNHESRLERVIIAQLPTFHGAMSLPELLDLEGRGIEWVPYKRLWRPELPSGAKGKLHYTHGETAQKHHAAGHLDRYGVSVRYGHTHKFQCFTRGFADHRVCISIGSPCLRTLDPAWIGPHSGWTHGFGYDEFLPDGTFTAHNLVMANRRFSWCGKVYG